MGYLVLVRHGKSEYNKLGLWTGKTDVSLVDDGRKEAALAGERICDIEIHSVHMSMLRRTHETFEEMRAVLQMSILEPKRHQALDERDYGVYTGKNKWEVKEEVGEEAFQRIRRNWDEPIKDGETLKDVHDRVVPYFKKHIYPELKNERNVLVISHGNTLRALVKYLEDIAPQHIGELEIGTGEVYCYEIDRCGVIVGKEIRLWNTEKLSV